MITDDRVGLAESPPLSPDSRRALVVRAHSSGTLLSTYSSSADWDPHSLISLDRRRQHPTIGTVE